MRIIMTNDIEKIGTYLLIDKETKKAYVGSTNDFKRRESHHKSGLNCNTHKNKNLQETYNAANINKFEDRFEFKKIPTESREDAFELEQLILDECFQSKKLFNLAPDATSSSRGRIRTAEEIEKLRQANLGKTLSHEHIEKMRQANLGKIQSQVTKDKRSASMLGKNVGKTHTDETKVKMSTIKLGNVLSDETKAKMSASRTGMKRTDESIANFKRSASHTFVSVIVDGVEYPSTSEAARVHGISQSAAYDRIHSTTGRFDNWIKIDKLEI